MSITVELVKSFTQNPEWGNPSGVIHNADHLSDEQMLRIAQQLGFPESAFLQSSNTASFKLRLFSVKQEVNSCVTATLAAAHVIAKDGNPTTINFETKIGNREVYRKNGGLLLVKQPDVRLLDVRTDREKIAALLNIPLDHLADFPIVLASAGTPKLLIPIKTLKDLFAIHPDLDGIAQYCADIGGRGFYPFTLETKNSHSDFHARQFNPQDGIAEDPVTGIAAVSLAKYFRAYAINMKDQLIGEQGYIINKPGEIIIEIPNNVFYVGGHATCFGECELDI